MTSQAMHDFEQYIDSDHYETSTDLSRIDAYPSGNAQSQDLPEYRHQHSTSTQC